MNNNLEGSANSPTYNYFFVLPEEKYEPLWTQIKILRSPTYNYFFMLPEKKYEPVWTQIKILRSSSDPVLKTTFKKDI